MGLLNNPDYHDMSQNHSLEIPRESSELVLLHEIDGPDSRTIIATLSQNGDLIISGHDLGPKVERAFGFDEYEFKHTIAAAYVKQFLDTLGVDVSDGVMATIAKFKGQRYYELAEAIERAEPDIPVHFWSYP